MMADGDKLLFEDGVRGAVLVEYCCVGFGQCIGT